MIIQIRGTSGSGKTTAAMSLQCALNDNNYVERQVSQNNRKQPLLHIYKPPNHNQPAPPFGPGGYAQPYFAFLGHYNTPCGGVDTITSRLQAFELADTYDATDPLTYIIMEGVIMSDDVSMTVALAKEHDVVVYQLTTPLDVCLKSIEGRRAAKLKPGQEAKPLNPANTSKRIPAIQRACDRLRAAGVQVVDVSRERLVEKLLELIPCE